jgi:hypothetical protein
MTLPHGASIGGVRSQRPGAKYRSTYLTTGIMAVVREEDGSIGGPPMMIFLYSYLIAALVTFVVIATFFFGKWPDEARREPLIALTAALFCGIVWPYSMVMRLRGIRA